MNTNNSFDEAILAKIDGDDVTAGDLLRHLKLSLNWHIVAETIEEALIQQMFGENKIEADEDEVQNYLNEYRKQHGLVTGTATEEWLRTHDLTDDEFFLLCEYELKLLKLKETLLGPKVEERYAFQKLDLEGVELYHIIAESDAQAREILAQLSEGAEFYGLAKSYSQEDSTQHQCGYMGVVSRRDLRSEIEGAVFSASVGQVVGPFKGARGYHLYLIDKFHPANLNDKTRQLLLNQLFREYLDKRLRAADVEHAIGLTDA